MGRSMLGRARTGSTLCPSCGMLVGVNDEQCFGCGRRRPGLFGFTPLLRLGDLADAFVPMVMWACGALYLACLVVDINGIQGSGFSFLSPSIRSLFLFGAAGAVPVFGYGRWWTVLSASWLHGGALHILFNMMWVRDLGPAVAHLYGGARTVIIYTVAGVVGFVASSLAGAFMPHIPFLQGGTITIGASASIFGLMGAVLHYGHRGGSSQARQSAIRWIVYGLAFGFIMPGIDNWAHLGGLAGGYLMSLWLDPLRPERGMHTLTALVCLLLSFAAILLSVVTALPMFRQG
jgi:membrane associated rhomboid family serine protease